jgi:hypothetical protein
MQCPGRAVESRALLRCPLQFSTTTTDSSLASPQDHPSGGKGLGFHGMPISTIETINLMIQELVYGRVDGMPNSRLILLSSPLGDHVGLGCFKSFFELDRDLVRKSLDRRNLDRRFPMTHPNRRYLMLTLLFFLDTYRTHLSSPKLQPFSR